MEQVYPYSQFPSTEPFPLQQYFKNFSDSAKLENEPAVADNFLGRTAIFNWLGLGNKLSSKQQKNIEKECSVDHLKDPTDHEPEDPSVLNVDAVVTLCNPIEITDEARQLEAVRVREEAHQILNYGCYRKYCGKEIEKEKPNKMSFDNIIPGQEFVVSVRVYRPFLFKYQSRNYSHKVKLGHEIQVLGSNRLTELRDTIICKADGGLCKEVEGKINDIKYEEAKDVYPSNFIFIENVFYNDLRRNDAIDYSQVIRDWAATKNINGLQTANMDDVFIKDLQPRIGYPYVYLHQGNCEHIIVFSDARLIAKNDPLSPYDYPYLSKMQRKNSTLCNMCGSVDAQWICAHSKRLPNEYVFMCAECFVSYNYIDEEKVGSFKAYPLYGQSVSK